MARAQLRVPLQPSEQDLKKTSTQVAGSSGGEERPNSVCSIIVGLVTLGGKLNSGG